MATKRKSYKRKSTRRVYARSPSHRVGKKKPVFHVVPDLLALGGVGELLVESETVPLIKSKDYSTAGNYLVSNLTHWSGLEAPVLLEAGAVIVKWGAKKLHLNNIGTKEFKLF